MNWLKLKKIFDLKACLLWVNMYPWLIQYWIILFLFQMVVLPVLFLLGPLCLSGPAEALTVAETLKEAARKLLIILLFILFHSC